MAVNNQYLFGINSDDRFCCNKDEYGFSAKLKNMGDIKIISTGITNWHAFVYILDDRLFSFGKNDRCQTGTFGGDNGYLPQLTDHSFYSNIKQIACGERHTLFLTIKGYLYCCGDMDSYSPFTEDMHYYLSSNNIYIVGTTDRNITKIGCCKDTSVFILGFDDISEDGVLTLRGRDLYEESHGISREMVPQCIIDFSCGYNHIGYITWDNKLYMRGSNSNGQCGYECIKYLKIKGNKLNIDNDSPIIDVKCGWYTTIIKTNKHNYYSFGNNESNQLLLNKKSKIVCVPTMISIKYVQSITKSNKQILDLIPGHKKVYILQVN